MEKNIPKGWRIVTYKDLLDPQDKKEQEPSQKETKPQEFNYKGNCPQHTERKLKQKKIKPLIWGDLSTKPYWKRNLFPVLLEAIFLILCFSVPKQSILYISFFFYLILFVFYYITKSFTFRNLLRNLTSGIHFWRTTIVSTILYTLFLTIFTSLPNIAQIKQLIPSFDLGFYPLEITNGITFFIFIVTTNFLVPIVEETFFRGNLISVESKSLITITTIVSILLFSISHSFTLWGILAMTISAIPLTIIFLKTRNFYVTMTANFLSRLIINLIFFI